MKEEKKTRNQIIIGVVAVLLLIIIVASTTYAYFNAKDTSAVQTVTTANLTIDYTDTEGSLVRASGIAPIKRENMLTEATKKTFTVTNTSQEKMFVDISLDITEIPTELKRYDFMWSLYEGNTNVSNGNFAGLTGNTVKVGEYQIFDISASKTYNLYIWIEETGLDQNIMKNKAFKAKVTATGTKYHTSPESVLMNDEYGLRPYSELPKDLIIPSIVDGFTVTSIGTAEFTNRGLTSLVLPNSLLGTGDNGFQNNDLTSIVIPNSLTYINYYTFADNQLTNLVMPNSVTGIGDGAFENNKLINVVLGTGVTSIGEDAFAGNQLTSIIIPKSVTSIGSSAFSNNPNLTEIIIQGKSSASDFTSLGMNWNGSCNNIIYRP